MNELISLFGSRLNEENLESINAFIEDIHKVYITDEQKALLESGIEIVKILLPLELDFDMIFAAILLPLLRNNEIEETITANYPSAIDLATSVIKIETFTAVDSTSEDKNLKNMLVALAKDIRVIIIKLADILLKARNVKKLETKMQNQLNKYMVNIYIPLASRLGLSYIKSELQDISLSIEQPNEYKKLLKKIAERNKFREEQIVKVIEILKETLNELNIKGEVKGRIKHISSIYNKIHLKGYDESNIYDFSAVRLIVTSINECYSVLGAVHTKFVPIDNRFKDYIARPKENGYQSLHTTVLIDDEPLEIQIRTQEMHLHAEYGIAAHFLYKEHKNKLSSLDEKLVNIKKMLENPEGSNTQEILDELKTEVYSGEIFVQTPLGKIIELPELSTPVDFAYAIHSGIGNKCTGAKVNGKMVPLNITLKNADIVEIITSVNAKGPSRDWLKFVKTSSAKSKINTFFKKEMKEENIKKGKIMLEQSAKIKEIDLKVLTNPTYQEKLFEKYSLNSLDDMYSAIGYGGLRTTQILNKIIAIQKENEINSFEHYVKNVDISQQQNNSSSIKELDSMLLKFAHCCNAIPGDDIVGFISRGRGVTVHRAECSAIKQLDANRIMKLNWGTIKETESYVASLKLTVKDSSGVLANISNKIAENKINITKISSTKCGGDKCFINVNVCVPNTSRLNTLISQLSAMKEVYEVERGVIK